MSEPVRILMVDDERSVLRAIQRLFLDEAYEILTAETGDEGIQLLEKVHPVQVVISDYRMPQRDGVDFLREVFERWPDTVRIVLSGYADAAAVVGAINQGHIYKFIPKPWNDYDLKVTLSNAVERYSLFQKNRQLTEELLQKNEELRRINESLEKTVRERTSQIILRNRALRISHNILDCLPVAVLGIDTEGLIVQCNRKATRLFAEKGGLIGRNRPSCLPEEINSLIEAVENQGGVSGEIHPSGRRLLARGSLMKQDEKQAGIILVLEENENG